MTEVTKEIIEAGRREAIALRAMTAWQDPDLVTRIYLAMREKDPEFVRLRRVALQGQEMAKEQMDRCVAAENEAKSLSTELAEAVEIMKPFSDSVEGSIIAEQCPAHATLAIGPSAEKIQYRHLRAARAFVEKHEGS